MRKFAGTLSLVTGLAAFSGATPLPAQEWEEFRTARQPGSFDALEVTIVYGAGLLRVGPSEFGLAYDVRIRYDAERFAAVRSWEKEGRVGKLRVSLRSRSGEDEEHGFGMEGGEFDFDLDDLRDLDDSSGRLSLDLDPSIPTELGIAVGAAESVLELGDLSLTELRLDTGASDTRLSFERPNRTEMGELRLKAGAASFEARKLGNANFETFRFEGGVGDVTLDFGGAWERDASGSIKVGVGALELRLPQDLGVRLRRRSFLTTFDAPGFTKTDDVYQTENWGSADVHLDLELDAAFGTITIERTP